MRRREFIALVAGAAVARPLVAQAQATQRKGLPVIGFLHLGSERAIQPGIEAFQSGLTALGYVEGQNIRVIYRFADGKAEHLTELTTELTSSGAPIIVTIGTTAIRAVHQAAPNVPIVSWGSADPVMMGWAQSLARPGGMITGLFLVATTVAKPLELLKELRPQATVFGYLVNAANPGNPHFRRAIEDAAGALGIKVEILEVKQQSELAEAFRRMDSYGSLGVAILGDPLFVSTWPTIIQLARQHRVPTVFDTAAFVQQGGLFALSPNYHSLAKRAAWYVDQILKGTPAGDLPAEQATEYKLFVNLKTAKELGLTIPASLLARADEVIE